MTDYPANGDYDIIIQQGATFLLQATWEDSNNVAIDITGYTAQMQIRESYDAPNPPLVNITSGSGITLGGMAGTIQAEIAASVTESLPTDSEPLYYDLLLTSGSGFVTRLLSGTAYVSPGVTHA